ncbi:transposase [Salinibacter ruber]|uniref:transposase n=1 Tax=Salinibacter ruber TaxID=146919 RepID=UPI002167E374
MADVDRRICPLVGRALLLSTVERGKPNPVHFEHYFSRSPAQIGAPRRTKCTDHRLPVGSFCTGWAESEASTLSGEARGRKRHVAVDTQGVLWGVVVHAAGDHETQWALQLLAPTASRLDRVETVFADQVYQGLEETLEEELSWELQVVESDDGNSGFSVDPKRSVARENLQLVRRVASAGPRAGAADRLQRDNGAVRHAPNRLESARLKIKTDSQWRPERTDRVTLTDTHWIGAIAEEGCPLDELSPSPRDVIRYTLPCPLVMVFLPQVLPPNKNAQCTASSGKGSIITVSESGR